MLKFMHYCFYYAIKNSINSDIIKVNIENISPTVRNDTALINILRSITWYFSPRIQNIRFMTNIIIVNTTRPNVLFDKSSLLKSMCVVTEYIRYTNIIYDSILCLLKGLRLSTMASTILIYMLIVSFT